VKIGFTYDLKDDYLARGFSEEDASEFDVLATIEAIEAAIVANGHEVERIGGLDAVVEALASGRRWRLVFNICEGVSGSSRESQVPALLEAFGIPVTFSASDVLTVCMDKALAKLVVRKAGVATPDFEVVRDVYDVAHITLPCPLFVKPLAEGTSKGVAETSRVSDRITMRDKCIEVLERFRQPALVETYLPGREFTVGLVGSGEDARVLGVCEIAFKPTGDQSAYSYRNKMEAHDLQWLIEGEVADEVADVALRAWQALGCRDAGRIDIRCDTAGRPNFIECNPLAGLRPGWSELTILADQVGLPYDDLIGTILSEALKRAGP
jgi:D-alanine-D-alanine ligase